MSKINKIKVENTTYDVEDSEVKSWARADSKPTYQYSEIQNTPDLSGYINKDVNNLTNYYKKTETYTQEEINNKLSSVYKYRGTVSTYSQLPTTALTIGDVYNVETADSEHGIKAGDNVAWNGFTWDVLSGTIDLSGYQTKIDSNNKLSSDLVDDTNNTNKFVTSSDKTNWDGKVGNTDYATTSTAGVIKLSNVYFTSATESGALKTGTVTYQQYLDANNGAFISKGTLENVITGKELQTQYSTMPTASVDLLGKIVQYIGTTGTYINGYFYKCVSDGQTTPTYSWEKLNIFTMNVTYTDNTTATFEIFGREVV